MKMNIIREEFGRKYLEFKDITRFHNQLKLQSVYWNRQRPRRYYDFPDDEIIENEDNFESIDIPDNKINACSDVTLQYVINNRRTYTFNDFNGDWTKEELYIFLNLFAGSTGKREYFSYNSEGKKIHHIQKLRAYPSGGGLYPVELYMYLKGIDGLCDGTYLYNPIWNKLILIREKSSFDELEKLLPMTAVKIDPLNSSLEKTNIILFLVANFKYTAYKYGKLAYKLAFLEAGHIGQNVQLAATALSKKTIALCGYYDDKVEEFLGLDGKVKTCLYVFTLG